MVDYKLEDCFLHWDGSGNKTVRCPECKDHGEDIPNRGDCKNIIIGKDGSVNQCQCYSEEHK